MFYLQFRVNGLLYFFQCSKKCIWKYSGHAPKKKIRFLFYRFYF